MFVCASVCLSAVYLKNLSTNCGEIFGGEGGVTGDSDHNADPGILTAFLSQRECANSNNFRDQLPCWSCAVSNCFF